MQLRRHLSLFEELSAEQILALTEANIPVSRLQELSTFYSAPTIPELQLDGTLRSIEPTLSTATNLFPVTPDLSSHRGSQTIQSTASSASKETPGSTKETAWEIESDHENDGNEEDDGNEPEVVIEPSPFPADLLASAASTVSTPRRLPQRHQTLAEQLRPILAEPDPDEPDSGEEEVPTGMSIADEALNPLSRRGKRKQKKDALYKKSLFKPSSDEETAEAPELEIVAEYWEPLRGKGKSKKNQSPRSKKKTD
jgi:hypothetical protein